MTEQMTVEEIIKRYLYAVGKRLSPKNRQDIEQELRSIISDMLEARCMDREPDEEDVKAVLRELGDPAILAQQYQTGANYLIGPDYYPQYCVLLKIVIPIVAIVMVFVSFLILLTGGETPLEAIAGLFSRVLGGVMGGLFWVTVVFILLERGGHKEAAGELQKSMTAVADEIKEGFSSAGRGLKAEFKEAGKEIKEEISWSPDKLSPLPERAIKRGGLVAGLVFTIMILLLFAIAPEVIGAWVPGDPWRCIPLFNLTVLQKLMPLFYLTFGLSFLRDVIQLAEGEYTTRVMWVTVGCNVISLFVCVFLFTRPELFNSNMVNEAIAAGARINDFADFMQTFFPKVFLGVLFLSFVLDTGDVVYKTLRRPAQGRAQ